MFIATNSFEAQTKEINTFVHPFIHIFTYAICLSFYLKQNNLPICSVPHCALIILTYVISFCYLITRLEQTLKKKKR